MIDSTPNFKEGRIMEDHASEIKRWALLAQAYMTRKEKPVKSAREAAVKLVEYEGIGLSNIGEITAELESLMNPLTPIPRPHHTRAETEAFRKESEDGIF
jgi:hypothetical protein